MKLSGFSLSAGVVLLLAVPTCYAQKTKPTSPAVTTQAPQISVIDIIPKSLSGETGYDSEPNIAVNPHNPQQIAASAFTREPMRRANRAPIFISTDGGVSWSLHSVIPSPQITCDITLRFGSSSDLLYISALRNEWLGYKKQELFVCQSAEYATTRLMGEIFNHRNLIDQPYIAAVTVAGKDHVFVGNSDFNYSPNNDAGKAVVDESLDAGHATPTPIPINYRSMTTDGDWSEVRTAIAAGGNVIYAAFNRVTSTSDDGTQLTADVIVVRDDEGGAAKTPFSSLDDPQGGHGLRAVPQRIFAGDDEALGGDRLGDDLAIAVHPTKPNKVYLVWGDWVNSHANLHLKYSTDGGKTWTDSKRDIANAKNPGLAVNANGTVGFLYQQVVNRADGDFWMTQFEQTTDDFQSKAQPLTLSQFPVPPVGSPGYGGIFLGDYVHLMAVGDDFYGIFSSDNHPDRSHFPYDVKFQRRESADHKKLLDLQGNEVKAYSIDPFFFKVTNN
jgi:hypothetical protein